MKFFYLCLCFFPLLGFAQSSKVLPDEFEKGMHQDSVQLLDVRTAGEYNSGHISGALQADWTNQLQFTERVKYLDKNRPVYVYCLGGGRSNAAASWMQQNGFTTIVDLSGGINAWKRENKPVEGASQEKQISLAEYMAGIPGNQTVLVDFGAKWCPPCVKMEPVLQAIQNDSSLHFTFIKMDAGVQTELMKSLGIEPIPAFLVYKNGKEVWRTSGLVSKETFVSKLK